MVTQYFESNRPATLLFSSVRVYITYIIIVIGANVRFLSFLFTAKSEDSCSSKPSSKNETLPTGCTVNGTNITTVNVGECKPVACVKGNSSFNSSCMELSLCCRPISFENVFIQCGALMSFDLSLIKKCGCGTRIKEQTAIEGIAVGQDGSAIESVDLFFAGQLVGRTDKNGRFYFVVAKATKRAIVTFKDQVKKTFQEEDKIFILNEGQAALYRVILRKKPQPIIFNASEPYDVPLGGETDNFADLELPENALLTEDGSVFSGNAKATVSVTDPRNQSDILSAPGDFTTTSEDGEEEMLETYGMMKLNLEDENGKPLTMSKPMKVYLDPEKLNLTLSDGNVSIKLYWLDRKTGRWKEVGDFFPEDGNKRRRKRSNRIFLAGTVTPSIAKKTLNFDTPTQRVALRVKINDPNKPAQYPDQDYLKNVVIRVIRKEGPNYKEYTERTTDEKGVVCISIWRGEPCYVQAEKNNKYYDPAAPSYSFDHMHAHIKSHKGIGETISSISFLSYLPDPSQGMKGPAYDIDNPTELDMCKEDRDPPPELVGLQFTFKPPENVIGEYSLLDPSLNPQDGGIKCFFKLNILTKQAPFMAVSYKKDDQNHTGKLGFHFRMSKEVTKQDYVVCLQFKCPKDEQNPTALLVTPMMTSGTCTLLDIEYYLKFVQKNSKCKSFTNASGQEKWLCMPYGSHLVPYFKSEAGCLAGEEGKKGTSTTGYGLKYDCR